MSCTVPHILCRGYASISRATSPRHFLSIADLSAPELSQLVTQAISHKRRLKTDPTSFPLRNAFLKKTVAMVFSKRSTRTRISCEGAVTAMGGHPMFLGKDDIQLGVNESLYDTSRVISSMVSCIFARVGRHSDVAKLAEDSSVPVINCLCDTYHPLQILADFQTMVESLTSEKNGNVADYLKGRKLAWVGDANNVLFDMCIGARKMGVDIAVATPKGYEIPAQMRDIIDEGGQRVSSAGTLTETSVPEEAIKNADFIVTDTWVSMGQEEEKTKRLKAFEGFQVTSQLAKRGGAKAEWKFMHCLPRHPEEVSDEVFYSPRSLVFPEAENRLYAAISALEGFVVNKGKLV